MLRANFIAPNIALLFAGFEFLQDEIYGRCRVQMSPDPVALCWTVFVPADYPSTLERVLTYILPTCIYVVIEINGYK
jgi:hypothetical protein